MISLYFALTFFLALRLSECGITYDPDCADLQDALEVRFGKSRDRLVALSQEMQALIDPTESAPGNVGLNKSALLLFPLANFSTVAKSTEAVANIITFSYAARGWRPSMTERDIVVRCSNKGIIDKGKKTYLDNETLDISIAQDPANVAGCWEENTLEAYVTVSPTGYPSIIRLCNTFIDREFANSATAPVRKCEEIITALTLMGSTQKKVVDLAVREDPYYVYTRALLQTVSSNLDNGGLPRSRNPFKKLQAIITPATDGWTAWRGNLQNKLVVPAAVAALCTLMEQQRYCKMRPNEDGSFQPSPGTQAEWNRWVSAADPDWA